LDEKVAHVTKKIKSMKANEIAVKETYNAQHKSVSQQEVELAKLERRAAKFEQEARAKEEIQGVTLSSEDLAEYSTK